MGLNEEEFKNKAEKEIIKCRPGDWNHALRVVRLVKKLGKSREDLSLIIIAAYIHDIGWKGLVFKNKISIEELKSLESKANNNSNKYAKNFLAQFDFSGEEIMKILKLIKAADKHESASGDEEIIVDADNLSKLSIDHIKEKYGQEDLVKMYNFFKERVPKRIKTLKGKKVASILLKKLENQIVNGEPK